MYCGFKPNLIHEGNALPLNRFSFKDGVLSAEDSDLRSERFDGHYHYIRQMWDDACDVGIGIRSHHTGRLECFYLSEEKKDSEGDLQYFRFLPVNERCKVKEVLIFND